MSDFYVTLPSSSSPKRYPNNTSNSFSVVMPSPLDLTAGEWEVGVVAVSLPEGRKPLKEILGEGPLFKEVVKGYWSSGPQTYTNTFGPDDIQNYQWSTGKTFMKSVANHLANLLTHTSGGSYVDYMGGIKWYEETSGGLFQSYNPTDLGETAYGAYAIDNNPHQATINTDNYLLIKKELAHKMGWIIPGPPSSAEFYLGPNLLCDIKDKEMPLPDFLTGHLVKDVKQYPPNQLGFMFAESVPGYYKLSRNVNWRFDNLNEAYDDMTKGAATTLYLYSDVCKSSIVGDQTTSFMREIPFFHSGAGQHYFEPQNVRHLPLQRNYINSIEIQISSDHSSKLAELGEGVTTVVLHFRQKQQ